MSDSGPESSPDVERDQHQPEERHSVLAELPRTRPQRPSQRRETARAHASGKAVAAKQARAPKAIQPERQPPRRKAAAAKATLPKRQATHAGISDAEASKPTPRQGYEAEGDLAGTPVSPPTGTELVGALAELVGELAQSGLSAGGRLLRGAFSRLSGS